MKKILKRFAKDKQSSATLEFYVVPGRPLFVCAEDFRRAGAGSEERMKVSNYIVSEKWSGANAYVIGIRETHHLGYPRCFQRSMLRLVRKLIAQALESYAFRRKLRDTRTRVEYESAVATIRQLEKDLAEAKVTRTAILQQMVDQKKLKAPAPFKLPLIK